MSDATRYAADVDPTGADSHALVVRAVRPGESVLELGCATGSTTKVLRDKGCRVTAVEVDLAAAARAAAFADSLVVADLDRDDLDATIGTGTYDVVVVADVLEHLLDPGRVLGWAARRLKPGGRVVASIPNVAHAAVRLALLTGTFRYDEFGLLDRTHVRFFTHESVLALFDGWNVASVDRVVVGVDDALVPFDRSLLPAGVEEWVLAQPEATTFQFVVVASPLDGATDAPEAVPRPTDTLLAVQGAALVAAEAEAARLRGALESLQSTFDYTTAALNDTIAERERTIDEIERSRAYRFMVRARALRRRAGR